MGTLLPLPGPTVGLATSSSTPTTTYYTWFKSLFDTVRTMFPGGGAGAGTTAWTDYVPTVTATTGTFTTTASGTYFQIGKVVFCQFTVTITAIGTSAGDLIVTVPVTPLARDQNFSGNLASNAQISGALKAADGSVHLRLYDGTTAIVAGRVIVASGFYEAA